MPNWVSNVLEINGNEEDIKALDDYIRGDNGHIDFNTITPMPKWVYGSSPDVNSLSTKDTARYGYVNTSLGFATTHWGTKWNASSDGGAAEYGFVFFETAWSGVPYLIYKLAVLFPQCHLTYRFADEDMGSNVGHYEFHGTSMKDYSPSDLSKEAYELAFDLVYGGIPDYYEWSEEENNYVYVEEDY